MSETFSTPKFVTRKGKTVVLTEEKGSQVTLRLPNKDCAEIIFSALLHNLDRDDQAPRKNHHQ